MAMNAAHLKNIVKSQDKNVRSAKTVAEVLKALPAGEFVALASEIVSQFAAPDQMLYIERLKAINAGLKGERHSAELSFKVSEKGALSVYGLGRFPVTLYKEQWKRVFAAKDRIEKFMADNDAKLKAKGE